MLMMRIQTCGDDPYPKDYEIKDYDEKIDTCRYGPRLTTD